MSRAHHEGIVVHTVRMRGAPRGACTAALTVELLAGLFLVVMGVAQLIEGGDPPLILSALLVVVAVPLQTPLLGPRFCVTTAGIEDWRGFAGRRRRFYPWAETVRVVVGPGRSGTVMVTSLLMTDGTSVPLWQRTLRRGESAPAFAQGLLPVPEDTRWAIEAHRRYCLADRGPVQGL